MVNCERVKLQRVFYDQRFPLQIFDNQVTNLIGIVPPFLPLTSVEVNVIITQCNLNLVSQTVDLTFVITKILNFNNIIIVPLLFIPTISDIPLPKFNEATIPAQFVNRLECQVFDAVFSESFTYNVITRDFTESLAADLTIKVDAEDQILVSLCPKLLTKTVTVTP